MSLPSHVYQQSSQPLDGSLEQDLTPTQEKAAQIGNSRSTANAATDGILQCVWSSTSQAARRGPGAEPETEEVPSLPTASDWWASILGVQGRPRMQTGQKQPNPCACLYIY